MADANIDIVIDCAEPETLAEFWAEALGYDKVGLFDNVPGVPLPDSPATP